MKRVIVVLACVLLVGTLLGLPIIKHLVDKRKKL